MSLGDVLALAGTGVPGLHAAITAGESSLAAQLCKNAIANHSLYIVGIIYARVQDVKVYKVSIDDHVFLISLTNRVL